MRKKKSKTVFSVYSGFYKGRYKQTGGRFYKASTSSNISPTGPAKFQEISKQEFEAAILNQRKVSEPTIGELYPEIK